MLNDGVNIDEVEIVAIIDDICEKIEKNSKDDTKLEDNVVENKTCEVPKRGFFYEHDNRLSDNFDFNDDFKQNNRKPRQNNRSSIGDKWEHDLYDINSQRPKSFKNGYRKHVKSSTAPTRNQNIIREDKETKRNEENNFKMTRKQNSFHSEHLHQHYNEINKKTREKYDYNNNKNDFQQKNKFTPLQSTNTDNNNYTQKYKSSNVGKNDCEDKKQNQEAPKKSYFLQRRKHNENNQEENNYLNKNSKLNMPHSKSEFKNLDYLNNNNHVYDEENNLINLTRSLSFSNSKYKKNDVNNHNSLFDANNVNDFRNQDNQDLINYQSEILKHNQTISSQNYFSKLNDDQVFNLKQQQSLKNLTFQQMLTNQHHFIALPPGIELSHILKNQNQHQYLMNQSTDYQNFGFQQYYNN